MTESESKDIIQGKLDCMKKCDIFNKEDNISDNDCDNCEYCYSQGNFGEQKEAFEIAMQALEKKIPKKPHKNFEKFSGVWCSCGKYLGKGYFVDKPSYCPDCGQKLDWSDEE